MEVNRMLILENIYKNTLLMESDDGSKKGMGLFAKGALGLGAIGLAGAIGAGYGHGIDADQGLTADDVNDLVTHHGGTDAANAFSKQKSIIDSLKVQGDPNATAALRQGYMHNLEDQYDQLKYHNTSTYAKAGALGAGGIIGSYLIGKGLGHASAKSQVNSYNNVKDIVGKKS